MAPSSRGRGRGQKRADPSLPESGATGLSCDSNELSTVARRIPAAKKGSDETETRHNTLVRRCLVKSVDFLIKNESEFAMTVWNMLETGMIAGKSGNQTNIDMLDECPKNIDKLPRIWKAQFLHDRSEGTLGMATLKSLGEQDENLISDVFAMFTKSQGTESLPADAQCRPILTFAMDERVKQVGGETIAGWAQRAIKVVDGKETMDTRAGSAYIMTFTNDRMSSIKHRSGENGQIPDWMQISKKFDMQHPFNDTKACVSKGDITPILLSSFFEKKAAPHQNQFDKKGSVMKNLFEEARVRYENLQKESGNATKDADAEELGFTDHAKKRRQEALQKAREKVSSRVVRRRTLRLAVSEPVEPK